VAGHAAADLHFVDVVGVVGVGDLEGRSPRLQDHHPAVFAGERVLFGHAQHVPVEGDGGVVVVGGDDEAHLLDLHRSFSPSSAASGRRVAIGSSPRAWTLTWSAPASRWAESPSVTSWGAPWRTRASIRRSEPPPSRSASVHPSRNRLRR